MTILFPGRKLTTSRGRTAASNTFRENLVQCIAKRIDKRHIVSDYAVSRDNVVYVPPQDEDHWLNELDWTGWVVIQLYTPDLRNDGKPTGSWILQSEWQIYQDVCNAHRHTSCPPPCTLTLHFTDRVNSKQYQ